MKQDFLYFLAVVNTYTSTNYRNHDTHNFCGHITAYTPFRDISHQTQPLEKHHGKHNLTDTSWHTHNLLTQQGKRNFYGQIIAHTTSTDPSRFTQILQRHHSTHYLYRNITAHTEPTVTSRQTQPLQTHDGTQNSQTHHGKNNLYKHITAYTTLQANHGFWVNKLSFHCDDMLRHNFHKSLLTDT